MVTMTLAASIPPEHFLVGMLGWVNLEVQVDVEISPALRKFEDMAHRSVGKYASQYATSARFCRSTNIIFLCFRYIHLLSYSILLLNM